MGIEPSVKTQVVGHPTIPAAGSYLPGASHGAQPTDALSTVVAAPPAGDSVGAAAGHGTTSTEGDGGRPHEAHRPGPLSNPTRRFPSNRDPYPPTGPRQGRPDEEYPLGQYRDRPARSRAQRRRAENGRARTVVRTALLCLLLAGMPILVAGGMHLSVSTATLIWMSVAPPVLLCVGGPVGYTIYRHLRAVRVGHRPRHAAPPTAATDPRPSTPGSPQPLSLGQRLAETMVVGHPAPPVGGQ
ncbi:MAG TPA: hypothetical protein VF755_17540 [Catenuloplanes sp.]